MPSNGETRDHLLVIVFLFPTVQFERSEWLEQHVTCVEISIHSVNTSTGTCREVHVLPPRYINVYTQLVFPMQYF